LEEYEGIQDVHLRQKLTELYESTTSKMTDYERTVLEHYQLSSPYPVEWPAEKDLSDASDDEEEEAKPTRAGMRLSKSRYSALERVASDRKSLVPGSQKTGDGVENLVQRDEPDPLGTTDSVVRILRQLGLPVSDDTRLR
jgi:exocyst complex component 2